MGGYQAAAAFRLLELGGNRSLRGWVFYGGWQRADRTSPALRATSPFQGEAERGGRLAAAAGLLMGGRAAKAEKSGRAFRLEGPSAVDKTLRRG